MRGGWPPGPEWSPAEEAEVAAGVGVVTGGESAEIVLCFGFCRH